MNILPLVLSFIMILGMISMSLFQGAHHTDYLAYQQIKYQKVQRALQNKLEKKALSAHLPPEKPNKGEAKKRTHYISPRLNKEAKESSKLHIASLFTQKKEPNLPLEKILSRLILILYGEKAFFFHPKYSKEELSTIIVKKIIQKGKQEEAPTHFSDLYPEDSEIKNIFYKMLKSKTAFGDYVSLEPSVQRKPICINAASIPLLQAAFGQKITTEILQKEEEKYFSEDSGSSILKADDFKEILTKTSSSESLDLLVQYHSPRKEKTTIRQIDPQSDLVLSLSIKHQRQ